MISNRSRFSDITLRTATILFFATSALAPVGYAGGTISSGEPDDLNIKLEMTVDEIDAWEARVSIKVLALSSIPDVTLRIASGGVAKIESPGFQKQSVGAMEVFGLPAKDMHQLKIGTLSPQETNTYIFLLPIAQAGLGSVMVTAFTEGPGGGKSVYVHSMFIADGKKILDDTNLLQIRVRVLEERLRGEGLSEANIQKRIQQLQSAAPSARKVSNP
jgi:hypothetical protein